MASNRALRPYGLESFSFKVAKRFLARHPEWLPFVGPLEDEEDGVGVRTLAIDLPSQNPSVPEPLMIAVDLSRIVVVSWFAMRGTLRWHLDWPFYLRGTPDSAGREDDPAGLDAVLRFVQGLLAEETVAFWTQDAKGGGTFGAVSAEDVRTGRFRRGTVRTEIRSWRGSLDVSLGAPPTDG